MDLIERFKYIMKLNQLTASAFAAKIGVQASSVSHVLSGRNKPSLEFIQKVLIAYPKIDSNWLISGTAKVQEVGQISAPEPKEKELLKQEKEPENRPNNDRSISKVLVFYSDGTFEEFTSLNRD